jgi:hypothetical protein
MECMMSLLAADPVAENIHECNLRLGARLDSLIPDRTSPASQPRAVTPQQMSELLSELMRAGEWLRSLPRERSAEVALELGDYRKNVERLRGLMPSIHATLLQERARLEQERGRVQSATEWARSSRQTL